MVSQSDVFCVCVCACVAVVNKIRLKVTDGLLREAEDLRASHAARLHEASSGYCSGGVWRSFTLDKGRVIVINASEYII